MASEEEIRAEEARFLEWARKYGVHKTIAEDGLELTDEIRPFVWTEFQNDDESFVDIGFTKSRPELRLPVVGYFISRSPCPEEDGEFEVVMSSALLDCPECGGEGEDETGDECGTCLGDRGKFVEFQLPEN